MRYLPCIGLCVVAALPIGCNREPEQAALSPTVGVPSSAAPAPPMEDLSTTPVETLIDDLSKINSQSPLLHGTVWHLGFIAAETPPRIAGGVMGEEVAPIPQPMRELTRRGVAALPQLIEHLDDQRPTMLKIGDDFFMFRLFRDEYQPKVPASDDVVRQHKPLERPFIGGYALKVGDVCYAIIGQIVNRSLLPVRYQPTGGLVVNSPIEMPTLVERVTSDWGGLTVPDHKASLITDAQADNEVRIFGQALVRLRFYYPDDYRRLAVGQLKNQIAEFESAETRDSR